VDTDLLLQAEMWELWLVDRAHGPTDQIHDLLSAPGRSESMLAAMAAPNVTILDSITIPLLTYRNTLPLPIDPVGTYVLILALDLGVVGGHYAAYYLTAGRVEVFDSMVTKSGAGVYTPVFLDLAARLFPAHRIEMVQPASDEDTLQPTGGFLWIPPSFPLSQDRLKRRIVQLCNHEAQDHFCWAWCLLYLHSRLAGRDLGATRKWLASHRLPPLALIKSYVWLLVSWFGLSLSPEVSQYFLSLWDAEDRSEPGDYRRYLIRMKPEPRHLTSVHDCLDLVLPPETVVLVRQEEKLPVPLACLQNRQKVAEVR
jgi:hypothetical protein